MRTAAYEVKIGNDGRDCNEGPHDLAGNEQDAAWILGPRPGTVASESQAYTSINFL
jgi:hypothetical protein